MRTTKKDSDKSRYQEIKEKKDQELEMLVKEHESELILDEDVEVDDESDLTGRLESRNITILPERGNILAEDGRLMASTVPQYYLYIDFML